MIYIGHNITSSDEWFEPISSYIVILQRGISENLVVGISNVQSIPLVLREFKKSETESTANVQKRAREFAKAFNNFLGGQLEIVEEKI